MTLNPTRTAGLERLQAFLPKAGRAYAARRNYDLPGHNDVSQLSPYIRHRLITEQEVLRSVLGRHSASAAEKFVQEVFWRTYWKGWLEMRPTVWRAYRNDLDAALNRVFTESGLRKEWEAACTGETGIAAFDHWARELVETGYLHNHARMWFASIWIFTLRLPWELGADFFMRHLLDADAASNTLSWRWVAGLQTLGKHYVARAGNIAKYTEGRFNPGYQLNSNPSPLEGFPHPDRRTLRVSNPPREDVPSVLVLTDEDLSPGFTLTGLKVVKTIILDSTAFRSPLKVGRKPLAFTRNATKDAASRHSGQFGELIDLELTPEFSTDAQVELSAITNYQIVTPYAPVGPTRDALNSVEILRHAIPILRSYDEQCWPHATGGFFKFKKAIPDLLNALVKDARASA